MPTKYRRKSRKSRRGRRKITAAVPQMMSRYRAKKRFQQVDARPFWFKYNGEILAQGSLHHVFRADPILYNIVSFQRLAKVYDEYQVQGFKLRLFPANVGTESHDPPGSDRAFFRGNHIIWSDQDQLAGPGPVITQIREVINIASAKMINPRRPYSRSVWRPYGHPEWASTEDNGSGIVIETDQWQSSINHFYQDASALTGPNELALFFITIQFKVLFRGRKQD